MAERIVQISMDVVVDEARYISDSKNEYPERLIAKAVEDTLGIEVLGCESVISWDYDKYMRGEVK